MEINRLLKLEDTDEGKILMIISNNLDLMYKGDACVTIKSWDKLTNEILAWHKYENEKLNMHIVGKSFNASFKKGDEVICTIERKATVIEEIETEVYRIRDNDLKDFIVKEETLRLAKESI